MTPAALAVPPSHSRHIVLVVGSARDDDEEIVTTLLEAGFDAFAVASASATLALMEGGLEPCVLLLDVDGMPEMDAWRFCEEVRARDEASRPAAVLLSYDHIDAARARVVDVKDYLRKPLALDRLVEAVERHCPRRLFPKFMPAAER